MADEVQVPQNDFSALDIFQENLLSQFWCAMCHSYSKVSMFSFRIFVSFASVYLCECRFITLLQIKIKVWKKLDAQENIRL